MTPLRENGVVRFADGQVHAPEIAIVVDGDNAIKLHVRLDDMSLSRTDPFTKPDAAHRTLTE